MEQEVAEPEAMEVLDEGTPDNGEVCGCCQAGTQNART